MKKGSYIFIIVSFFLIFIIGISNVYGESAGGTGNSSSQSGSGAGRAWNQTVYGYNSGIKITVYRNNGTKIASKFFVNDENDKNDLNAGKAYIRNSVSDRLTEVIDEGNWVKSNTQTFYYLQFNDIMGNNISQSITDFLKAYNEEDFKKIYNLVDYTNSQLKDVVLVVEPATTFKRMSDEALFFGTYWDFVSLQNYNSGFKRSIVTPMKNLRNAIHIKSTEISSTKTPGIWNFLGNFKTFRNKVQTKQSDGVAIILYSDVYDVKDPVRKDCSPKVVKKGNCSTDFEIQENTDKDCVINNPGYLYDSITDCGVIYCAQTIKSDLNSFYSTFTSSTIISGHYFPMNSLKIDISKTCYLRKYNNNSSCSVWGENIKSNVEKAGTIGLKQISNYDLIIDRNKSTFKRSYSGEKVLINEHLEYVLPAGINRYISIFDMANTSDNDRKDIIDLGTEHLTTPIYFSTGEHTYELDFSKSILVNAKKRIDNLPKQDIELSGGDLILDYKTDKSLIDSNLKYSCPYNIKNINDCYEVECDDNKSCDCKGECCDNKCNVVECSNSDESPGGFPNIVYRPISLTNPFPGIKGNNRTPGSNWNRVVTDNDGKQYSVVEYYITNNRGYKDYDIYKRKPLYTIKLDSATMNAIRTYNKTHDYNNFDLTCVNGENCISNFLRGKAKDFDIDLLDSEKSACKNITPDNFEACLWN